MLDWLSVSGENLVFSRTTGVKTFCEICSHLEIKEEIFLGVLVGVRLVKTVKGFKGVFLTGFNLFNCLDLGEFSTSWCLLLGDAMLTLSVVVFFVWQMACGLFLVVLSSISIKLVLLPGVLAVLLVDVTLCQLLSS